MRGLTRKQVSSEKALAMTSKARECIHKGDLEQAKNLLRESLAESETAEAHHYTGVVHYLRGERENAAKALLAAVAADSAYHRSFGNLAALAEEDRNYPAALQYIALAIKADPTNSVYMSNLVSILRFTIILAFDQELKDLITLCLETDNLDHIGLFPAWHSQLKTDPSFRQAYKLFGELDYPSFEKKLRNLENPDVLLQPFFLFALKRLILFDSGCECFLVNLRRFLLENHRRTPDLWNSDPVDMLWCALAEYCFHTEYVFDVTMEEQAKVDELRKETESFPAVLSQADCRTLITIACYEPLACLADAETWGRSLAAVSPATRALATVQIDEPLDELRVRDTIPVLTPIDDEMSKTVRGQYEVFPYPRWRTIGTNASFGNELDGINDQADILIAGCGTGYESARYGSAFPGARVTAIDLSLSSLSYAIRKARELKLTNVSFGQADLLEVKRLGKTFDLVVSTGVLVCVTDPLKAWSGLVDVLKPGGIMHVGLYSRIGRQGITEARTRINQKGYGDNAEEIRRFRRDAPRILSKDTLKRLHAASDYYTLSEVRDFLFHVHEICFDIREIQSMLEKLGLEFIKFNVPNFVMNQYRDNFPDDLQAINLAHWHEFEVKNPNIFGALYMFWCRKK